MTGRNSFDFNSSNHSALSNDPPSVNRKMKEQSRNLVDDNTKWREFQEELKSSKAITGLAVHEVARRFVYEKSKSKKSLLKVKEKGNQKKRKFFPFRRSSQRIVAVDAGPNTMIQPKQGLYMPGSSQSSSFEKFAQMASGEEDFSVSSVGSKSASSSTSSLGRSWGYQEEDDSKGGLMDMLNAAAIMTREHLSSEIFTEVPPPPPPSPPPRPLMNSRGNSFRRMSLNWIGGIKG